jgi:aminoglycoside phosphotransferase (APT) family kinase protein
MNELQIVKKLVAGLTSHQLNDEQIIEWSPTKHQSNRIYQIQLDNTQWIAKIFLDPEEIDDAARREYHSLKLLSSLNIAPQPIHYEKPADNQKPIVIYEFMQGEMWNRTPPTQAELAQLADLWIQMNSVSVENLWLSRGMERKSDQIVEEFNMRFQKYADWTAINFPEGQKTASYLQAVAERQLGILDEIFELQPPLYFSRSDPRFANIIRRPDDRIGMIDWEDAGLRDVARDLADIVVHPNQEDLLSWQEWQAFLQPYYAERRKVDPDIEMRVQLYHAIFPLFWLSGLVSYGIRSWEAKQLDSWRVNTMGPNLRLQRYLARAMAYPKMDFERELKELEGIRFFDLE